MKVGLVLGPEVSWLVGGEATAGARARVRTATESPASRAAAVRELFAAGVNTLLIVDRAFPVRPDWARSGALLALVADHINLTGDNPLVGANADEWGPRFPDLTDAWDPALRRVLRDRAIRSGVVVQEGVLAGVTGSARTAAELAMLRMIGADMVSQGFVHEAIVARHAGRRVVGIAVLASGTALPGDEQAVGTFVRRAIEAMTETATEQVDE